MVSGVGISHVKPLQDTPLVLFGGIAEERVLSILTSSAPAASGRREGGRKRGLERARGEGWLGGWGIFGSTISYPTS